MKELYHGVEIEVIRERSHLGWTRLYWSMRSTSTWAEIDSDIEPDGSAKKLMGKLKRKVDERRKEW